MAVRKEITEGRVKNAIKAMLEAGEITEKTAWSTKKMAGLVANTINESATGEEKAVALEVLQDLWAKKTAREEDGAEEEADEDGSEGGGASKVRERYKKAYAQTETKTGCADEVDVAFRAKTDGKEGEELLEVLRKIADDNKVDPEKFDRWTKIRNRDGSTNTGMVRMNLSNVLRAKLRRGEKVKIGSETWAADPAKAEEAKKKSAKAAERLKNLKEKSKAKKKEKRNSRLKKAEPAPEPAPEPAETEQEVMEEA